MDKLLEFDSYNVLGLDNFHNVIEICFFSFFYVQLWLYFPFFYVSSLILWLLIIVIESSKTIYNNFSVYDVNRNRNFISIFIITGY